MASGALRQLLENLLTNAVEHGGPDVAVEVGLTDTGFYVADDGPGVPAAERDQVFEHGFTTGGTGVGLAVAAEIADAHGWETRLVESSAGGARFEYDRCLRRLTDAAPPAEAGTVALSTETTVGDPAVDGSATRRGDGGWTLTGGGRAVWGGIEEYTAVLGTVDGDCRVVGELTGLDGVHEHSKAGVLVVDAAEPDRPLGFAGATAERGHETAWRPEPTAPIDTRQIDDGDVVPHWYRIDRVGDRLTCYASPDGEDWTVLDQNVPDLSGSVAAGVVVNSHEVGTPCEATFENVRLVELESESDGES